MLVEFIVCDEIPVVLSQPSLVRVKRIVIACRADEGGIGRIGHVDNGHGVFIAAKGDFLAGEIVVRTDVGDDLGVMCVSVSGKLTDECGVDGVADVEDVQAAIKSPRADTIGAPCALVDDNVVGIAPAGIEGIGLDGLWRVADAAQLGEVHNLQAVSSCFRNDEGMVVVDLDVTPHGAARFRWKVGHHHGIDRV